MPNQITYTHQLSLTRTNNSHYKLLNNSVITTDNVTKPDAKEKLELLKLWQSGILAFIMISLCILTSAGNFLVLYAIRIEKKLRTVSNLLILSLAVSDFLVGSLVMPISTVYTLTGNWYFGLVVCNIWLSVDYTASTASILNMFILSLDRYWSVTQPLRYIAKRTKKRARLMILSVWFLASLWIIPINGWHAFANNGIRTIESGTCDTEYSNNKPLKVATGLFNFFIPIIIMYGLYGRIFYEIRHRTKIEKDNFIKQRSLFNRLSFKNRRQGSQNKMSRDSLQSPLSKCNDSQTLDLQNGQEKETTFLTQTICETPTPSPIVQHNRNNSVLTRSRTIRKKISEASEEESSPQDSCAVDSQRKTVMKCHQKSSALSREIKAARQLGIIMSAFTLCFLPYFVCFMIIPFCPDCVSDDMLFAFIWIGYFNSTLNPFLYPLCNNAFRDVFKQILCRKQASQSNNNGLESRIALSPKTPEKSCKTNPLG